MAEHPKTRLLALALTMAACTATPPPRTESKLDGHFQNAYVTRNLEKSIAVLESRYGVTPILRFSPEMTVDSPAGKRVLKLEVGLVWVGPYQIEIIQPVTDDLGVYRNSLPEKDDGSLSFHHIGMRTHDFDATRSMIARDRSTIAFEGSVPGVRFVYVDARDTVGHYLEYVWCSPEAWRGMGGRG